METVVVVGVGEIGGVFSRGFLRSGLAVYPLRRGDDPQNLLSSMPMARLVLVSVGEADLVPVLERLPDAWRDRTVLVQNELLPLDWEPYSLVDPTVMSVWFEKKKGQDVKVVLPSPVWGPQGALLIAALGSLDIPAVSVADREKMVYELVRKNLYILVTNVCGLTTGGTVGELWSRHPALVKDVATEVLQIQQGLVGSRLETEPLIRSMLEAFDGDPQHKCLGRSAPQRLRRAVDTGDRLGLSVPVLRRTLEDLAPTP